MGKKDLLTRILTIIGTLLVLAPVLMPFIFMIAVLIRAGEFHFDFLMPAELFLVVLAGGLMLMVAAWRARSQRKWVGWSLAGAAFFLGAGMLLASVSGLASGAREPQGFWLIATIALLVLFDLMVVALGIGGIRLWMHLFRKNA